MANLEIGTSTGNTSGNEYQVFLNFRGPDTRHTFTDFLHRALVDVRIRVFIDDEGLRPGERISGELLQAIDNSMLYIPIFSKDYASSHWCLDELARIVDNASKHKDGKEKVILPIFYNVKPEDVKLKSPLYKDVISNLEQKMEDQKHKFSSENIKMWRESLMEVGAIKGWEVEKHSSPGELIQAVVDEVMARLSIRRKRVTRELVGMKDRIADIKKLLDIDSGGVRLIGIYGMGGVGKTTLAKIIFNELCPQFGRNCSFLDDVRERIKSKGLVKLQKQLLSDISNRRVADSIANSDHAIDTIEDTIYKKKMLIVLDDVNEASQIQNLIGEGFLYSGTIILVTTRDKSILNIRGFKYKFQIYEMMGLRSKDALKLFSRHAFNDDSPPDDDYYTLSVGIVYTTYGLPLALKAIGASLFGKNREIWEERLDELKKTPDRNVLETLKISYDALEKKEQEIFLDIACFFVGENKSNPMYMWKDCKFSPEGAIDILINRCMIKVLDDNSFWMHDQFRDLGRQIAEENRTRLRDKDDIICELRLTETKSSVQALSLASPWDWDRPPITITSEQIKRFPHMRFLSLYEVICRGDFMGCLYKLKWINLKYGYAFPSRPGSSRQWFEATNSLHLENVVVVNLSGLDITEDAFGSLIMAARKLKVLTVSYNTLIRRTPTFSWNSNLEKLTISKFLSLMEIDCSIGKLTKLIELSFELCVELEKLPEQIGELQNLQHLSLRGCDSLRELPDSVLKLKSLMKLDLLGTRITGLSDSIDGLSSLLSINVSFTLIEKLPSTMSELLLLQTLHLNDCNSIQELPELPRSLTTLQLTSFSLATVPNLSYLTNLAVLTLSDGSKSKAKSDIIQTCDLQWIGSLSRLSKLQFCFSNICVSTIELGSLSQLKELTLHGLDVPAFRQLPSELIVLELYDTRGKKIRLPPSEEETETPSEEETETPWEEETEIPWEEENTIVSSSSRETPWEEENAIVSSSSRELGEKKARRQLEISFLEGHNSSYRSSEESVQLREEPGCSELQAPDLIDHWRGVFHFPSSRKMLQRFVLWGCPGVQDIQFVDMLESLLVFSVGGCTSLKRLRGLSNLKNLMELTLNRCWSLQAVEGINELKFLHALKIDRCGSVERILDPSNSKIPDRCSILITGSGELPDCGRTYDTWESYRVRLLREKKESFHFYM